MSLHRYFFRTWLADSSATGVTRVPCQELVIGSWRHVAHTVGTQDSLIAYICPGEGTMTWLIRASNYHLKIEVRLETVSDIELVVDLPPDEGRVLMTLQEPPALFQKVVDGDGGDADRQGWRPRADWMEGLETSEVVRHRFIGSRAQLARLLRTVLFSKPGASAPTYHRITFG